jgi:glycosidase
MNMKNYHTYAALWLFMAMLAFSCGEEAPTPVTPPPTPNPYTDPPQYDVPFAKVPDTKDIIMYEINQRAFSAAGDFNGIIDRLDHIKALNVNVIWLMPIHPIGALKGINSPYSVRNFKEVNPEFGNLETLRLLVKEAHKRDMAVIIDWVANHTSWDNPWISSNPSWYTQVNGAIVSPIGTNWADVADLNYSNSQMRLGMIDALKYWVLDANIDGFRCDAADMVPADFWQQAIDSLKKIPNRKLILLAEGGEPNLFGAGFQINYGWDFYGKMKGVFGAGQPASNLYLSHIAEYSGMPSGREKLRFTTNHDESAWDKTPMVLFNGKSGALAASAIATYMGGIPLIYAGQETGRSSTIPFFTKSPIDWTANPDMVLAYQKMMEIRKNHEALKTGSLFPYSSNDVVAFTKTTTAQKVLVMVNVRNSNVAYTVPSELQNTSWTNLFTGQTETLGTSVALAPYEYQVLLAR